MDKDKQQKAIFIALFFLCLIFGVYYFLLSPLYEDIQAKEAQKEQLTDRLSKAKKVIQNKKKVMAQFELNKEVVKLYSKNMPLPRNDEQSWLVSEFAKLPRNLDLEWSTNSLGRTLSLGTASRIPLKAGTKPQIIMLEDYSFRIDLTCSFHNFGKTIAWLERKNPGCFIERFSCSAERGEAGRNLGISLTLTYPRFTQATEKKLESTFEKEK